LSKVQVWIQANALERPSGDPYFLTEPWIDAQILPPPANWGALPDGKIPAGTLGFDPPNRQPPPPPLRLARGQLAAVCPRLPAGEYSLHSRTIDNKGQAQPMPRPFQKSGNAAIESVDLTVKS